MRDGRAWDRERLRRTATIGLGRAVLTRLTDGTPWTVLCVNTDRPLFWLLARDAYTSAGELKGRRIGIHPVGAGFGTHTQPDPPSDRRSVGAATRRLGLALAKECEAQPFLFRR